MWDGRAFMSEDVSTVHSRYKGTPVEAERSFTSQKDLHPHRQPSAWPLVLPPSVWFHSHLQDGVRQPLSHLSHMFSGSKSIWRAQRWTRAPTWWRAAITSNSKQPYQEASGGSLLPPMFSGHRKRGRPRSANGEEGARWHWRRIAHWRRDSQCSWWIMRKTCEWWGEEKAQRLQKNCGDTSTTNPQGWFEHPDRIQSLCSGLTSIYVHQSILGIHEERLLQTRINLWRKLLSFTWRSKREFHGNILADEW